MSGIMYGPRYYRNAGGEWTEVMPRPEAYIRLMTINGRIITRRLTDMSKPLVDDSGFYITATGGSYHAATEKLPANIHSEKWTPGTQL